MEFSERRAASWRKNILIHGQMISLPNTHAEEVDDVREKWSAQGADAWNSQKLKKMEVNELSKWITLAPRGTGNNGRV